MIVDDLHKRLRAALPESVPVLRPEQFAVPGDWYEKDADGEPLERGEHGLHVYLREQAPGGYVQIEPLTPLSSGMDGIQQRVWATVSANASSEGACQRLYDRVHFILCGIPGREPGYYLEKQAGVVAQLAPDYWQTRLTLTRPVIGGRI